MSNKFKAGDKVKRVDITWDKVKEGWIYTVERIEPCGCNPMTLEEVAGRYSPTGFTLVEHCKEEEPKQCPIELVKVWEEMQKPTNDGKVIEMYDSELRDWVLKISPNTHLNPKFIYRIKPEPLMTWEEFKEELFKLSNTNNVFVEGSLYSIRVIVEYAGLNQRVFSFSCNATEVFKQSTIDSIKAYTGVSK